MYHRSITDANVQTELRLNVPQSLITEAADTSDVRSLLGVVNATVPFKLMHVKPIKWQSSNWN